MTTHTSTNNLPHRSSNLMKYLGVAAVGVAAMVFGAQAVRAEGLDRQDRKFFSGAAEAGNTEISASKIALQKSANPSVKSFANTMIEEHTKVADNLKQLAASKNVVLPNGPSASQQAKIDALSKLAGPAFDQRYAEVIGISAHDDTIKLFKKTAADSKDADVKNFAMTTLPGLQHHLDMAKQLKSSVAAE